MKKILFLSPHSDDIALSLGGFVNMLRTDIIECHMHTIFTISKHAPYLDEVASIDQITEQRIHEDQTFCQRLTLEYHNAGFNETTVRGYPTIESIFQVKTPIEDPLYASIEDYLRRTIISANWDFIFSPAGIGNHVEHTMVREICKTHFPESTVFYEDLPYANDFGNTTINTFMAAIDKSLQPISISFSSMDKLELINLYKSQIGKIEQGKVIAFGHRSRPEFLQLKRNYNEQLDSKETIWIPQPIITKFKSLIC